MNIAIIAAAGSGNRMASDRPKQFLALAGTPIIIHTLKAFDECDNIHEVLVVLAPEQTAEFLSLANQYKVRKISRVVNGGVSRADSVKRGLLAVRPATAEIVAVHDGVRPFVTAEEISNTIVAAQSHGAALLVAPAIDTIKRVSGGFVVETLDRARLRHALTPQCFRYELLRRAYEGVDVEDPTLTDESVLVERLGERVAIVEGSPRNIKITTPGDLSVAEQIFRNFEL